LIVACALGRVFLNFTNFFIDAATSGSRFLREPRARAIQFGGMFPLSFNSARDGDPFANSNNLASRGIVAPSLYGWTVSATSAGGRQTAHLSRRWSPGV
jgi:hypothetical protein